MRDVRCGLVPRSAARCSGCQSVSCQRQSASRATYLPTLPLYYLRLHVHHKQTAPQAQDSVAPPPPVKGETCRAPPPFLPARGAAWRMGRADCPPCRQIDHPTAWLHVSQIFCSLLACVYHSCARRARGSSRACRPPTTLAHQAVLSLSFHSLFMLCSLAAARIARAARVRARSDFYVSLAERKRK